MTKTVSNEISISLQRYTNGFDVFKYLEITYGGKKLSEKLRFERKAPQLIFKDYYDLIRFVKDFQRIIDEYSQMDNTLQDDTIVAIF